MDEQIHIIITKHLCGEATAEEQKLLEEWLQADAENMREYDALKEAWQRADTLFEPNFDTASAWQMVQGKIETVDSIAPKVRRVIPLRSWLRLAGVAAVLLIAFVIWKPSVKTGEMQTVVAQSENRTVTLPDQSVVTLRTGSSLSYPEKFEGKERNIELDGEAFFEVTRDEEHPFVIDAQAGNVKVLGTSFNVKCSDKTADVNVATGKVQLTATTDKDKYVILTPNEKGTVAADGSVTESTADDDYLFWKDNILKFENKPLKDVIATIAKAYNVNLKPADNMPIALLQQKITISFERQSIEDVLTELCMIARCKWKKENSAYIIEAK